MSQPVHFQAPFAFNAKGVVKTNVQDTPNDIRSCVYNICVCEEGVRIDEPAFGIPDLAFETVPMKLQGLEVAVERWEPRATAEAVEQALVLTEQNNRLVTLNVSP